MSSPDIIGLFFLSTALTDSKEFTEITTIILESCVTTTSTLYLHVSWSVSRTDTGRSGCIPLCEGAWHGLALNGAGSFQQVTWTAFEPDHRTSRELRTDPPAIARLWYWAALAVAGAWHSCSTSMTTINSRKWSRTLTIHRKRPSFSICLELLSVFLRKEEEIQAQAESYLGKQSGSLWLTGHS